MSLIVLYFLHNTSVLSFYIDVVLTLSIGSCSNIQRHGDVEDLSPIGVQNQHFKIGQIYQRDFVSLSKVYACHLDSTSFQ